MAANDNELMQYVLSKVKENEGVLVPVKASLLERALVRKVRINKLHPNPDDEFCFPNIGPSYRIIENYVRAFTQFNTATAGLTDDPLQVEKVHPYGYMILNGHHRWAAARKVGRKKIKVEIVNLTQETDIEKMIKASNHDKRVTLDLDEVVFCLSPDDPPEKQLGFPFNRIYKEKIRYGIPALLHFLAKQGYDVWVYSANYYSLDYIKNYFKHYSVKMDGIITGTGRKMKDSKDAREKLEKMMNNKYKETIHIDRNMVLRTIRDTGDFEEKEIVAEPLEWSRETINIIKKMCPAEN
ncbi:MAG: ParB/RepB/Spo0J family partition protein [Lachnospiraceae bacterium]|nr:ParB/RepB/Spo0J family partition protein [Lachnospiraceae bacterium]